jgi:hypothetical protein
LLARRRPRIRRLVVGAGPGLALCLAAAGLAWGQGSTPQGRTPQQVVPGGPKLSTLPDLVVLEFHYSMHLCSFGGKPSYRGWFSGKNQGLGPALFTSDNLFVGLYFRGKMIAQSIYPNNQPIPAGAEWKSDLYFPQPAGPPPYQMVARVDPSGKVKEVVETNNDLPFVIKQDARTLCKTSVQPIPGGPKLPAPKP